MIVAAALGHFGVLAGAVSAPSQYPSHDWEFWKNVKSHEVLYESQNGLMLLHSSSFIYSMTTLVESKALSRHSRVNIDQDIKQGSSG